MFYYDAGFLNLCERSQSALAHCLTVPLTLQPYFKFKCEIRKMQLSEKFVKVYVLI